VFKRSVLASRLQESTRSVWGAAGPRRILELHLEAVGVCCPRLLAVRDPGRPARTPGQRPRRRLGWRVWSQGAAGSGPTRPAGINLPVLLWLHNLGWRPGIWRATGGPRYWPVGPGVTTWFPRRQCRCRSIFSGVSKGRAACGAGRYALGRADPDLLRRLRQRWGAAQPLLIHGATDDLPRRSSGLPWLCGGQRTR